MPCSTDFYRACGLTADGAEAGGTKAGKAGGGKQRGGGRYKGSGKGGRGSKKGDGVEKANAAAVGGDRPSVMPGLMDAQLAMMPGSDYGTAAAAAPLDDGITPASTMLSGCPDIKAGLMSGGWGWGLSTAACWLQAVKRRMN